MMIAVKVTDSGMTYIDKKFVEEVGVQNADKYGFNIIQINDEFSDCEFTDFDGLIFNVEKYRQRKHNELMSNYNNMIVCEIRKKYSLNQELAILRQRDSKFYEYQEYFDYVEQCKSKAKQFFNLV